MTSRFPPLQTLFNELRMLFGIMSAAGRFDWLSDNKVIAFRKQVENKNTKNKMLETCAENRIINYSV